MKKENITCAECGMTGEPREFHPIVVCALFKLWRDSRKVEANVRAVVEYGMKVERYGITLDDAMRDFNTVLDMEFQQEKAPKSTKRLPSPDDVSTANG